jgi:hypothetical protein
MIELAVYYVEVDYQIQYFRLPQLNIWKLYYKCITREIIFATSRKNLRRHSKITAVRKVIA